MIQGLSEKLKTLRMQFNYSQKEVSDLLDISPTALSGYETGDKTPSLERLVKFANLYHVSSDYLLGLDKTDSSRTVDVSHLSDEQYLTISKLISLM